MVVVVCLGRKVFLFQLPLKTDIAFWFRGGYIQKCWKMSALLFCNFKSWCYQDNWKSTRGGINTRWCPRMISVGVWHSLQCFCHVFSQCIFEVRKFQFAQCLPVHSRKPALILQNLIVNTKSGEFFWILKTVNGFVLSENSIQNQFGPIFHSFLCGKINFCPNERFTQF
jgi:hypothetical protein